MSFASKQDRVAEIIREKIIVGTYTRGQRLKQADLAEEIGVSITPIREALLILEAEGYIRRLSHKGVLVPELVPSQARETYELRVMLERELTSIALSKMTSGKLKELRDLQKNFVRLIGTDYFPTIRAANYRFHFKLYEMAERPQTLHFVRVLWARYPFTAMDGGRPERHDEISAEHELFLQRAEEDDHAGAVDAMVEHIKAGWRQYAERQNT
ncbi:GntR family transcriptional regulator [Reyranella sp. CPCC 100927]|uniref:GntR family transcriptional regulator n=1 Tax=Reyranella sp. CPCC 100927 TaxID=2599616 RepID=UPI0011B7B2E8|nr:GntR family transcriptional regulator [Reyranella sp. CPCC 100927]TWS98471.1 GntR family transcriptional regulator [Reyranella sp. CPCC 100927]